MGNAILSRRIGLVYKTLKMSFFSRKLSFSQLTLGFGSMTPKKTDLIEWRQQLNWYPEKWHMIFLSSLTFGDCFEISATNCTLWEIQSLPYAGSSFLKDIVSLQKQMIGHIFLLWCPSVFLQYPLSNHNMDTVHPVHLPRSEEDEKATTYTAMT